MVTFLALAHMVVATQHHVPCTCTHGRCYASHGIGVGWGGDDNVLWTCTRGRCYASHGMGWGGDDNVLWTCTHGRCYASHGMGWGGAGMITFSEVAHMVLKKQRQQKTDTKGLTVRHCNFFSCSNSLRLPVNYVTTSKNTVAHSTFEHLEHHNISKIVIFTTQITRFLTNINVWMMDFSSINTRIKKFRPRRTQFYVENDFFKNSRFATAK